MDEYINKYIMDEYIYIYICNGWIYTYVMDKYIYINGWIYIYIYVMDEYNQDNKHKIGFRYSYNEIVTIVVVVIIIIIIIISDYLILDRQPNLVIFYKKRTCWMWTLPFRLITGKNWKKVKRNIST